MNPLIIFGVQSYVFRKIMLIQVPEYSLFLLSGLLPWIFFSQTVEMCVSLYLVSGRLLKAFPVHPLVYLASQILDNGINFLAAFSVLLIPKWVFGSSQWSLQAFLVLPIAVILLVIGTFFAAWIMAVVQVFFRDTRFLVSFALSILFFLTPVFYPTSQVPPQYRWIVQINPVHYLISPFRATIYQFDWNQVLVTCQHALAVDILLGVVAVTLWRKKRNALFFYL